MEAPVDCILTKLKGKYTPPWETLAVKEKHDDVKSVSNANKRNPTNAKTQKLKKVQNESMLT